MGLISSKAEPGSSRTAVGRNSRVRRLLQRRQRPLPEGLATIFRRAEWPEAWPGRDRLEDGANPGLLLRLLDTA